MKRTQVTKIVVTCAMLVALNVVLSRIVAVNTQYFKLSFGFVPLAMAGMLFGPWWSCAVAAIADVIGATLFPSGPFFPGFTLSSALMGLFYGLCLHQKEGKLIRQWEMGVRAAVAIAAIGLLLEMGLNNLFLHYLYGNGLMATLPLRIIKTFTMMPVKYVVIMLMAPIHSYARQRG